MPKFRQIRSHCSQPSSDFRYTNVLSKIKKLPQRKTFLIKSRNLIEQKFWQNLFTSRDLLLLRYFILSVVIDFLERPSLVCTRFSICRNWYKRLEKMSFSCFVFFYEKWSIPFLFLCFFVTHLKWQLEFTLLPRRVGISVTSGQSYKHSTILNYDSRVVILDIFKSGTTLES